MCDCQFSEEIVAIIYSHDKYEVKFLNDCKSELISTLLHYNAVYYLFIYLLQDERNIW